MRRPKYPRQIIPKIDLPDLQSKIKEFINKNLWHIPRRPYDISNAVVFVNKRARGYYSPIRRYILRCFIKKRGIPAIHISSIAEITKSKEAKKAKCIFIASGDGFFDGVLSHSFFNNKTIGFFPMGAGNAVFPFLYKMKTFFSLCSNFKYYETKVDVLKLKYGNKEMETTWLSIGLDAEFIRLHPPRSKNGLVDYSKAVLSSMHSAKSRFEFKVKSGKKKFHWKNGVSITLGKFPFYGFGVRSLPYNININDGYVYGLVCKSLTKNPFSKALRVVAFAHTMAGVYHPSLKSLKAKQITIESSVPLPIQVAGDFLGYSKKISVEVKRKQKLLIA